MLLTRRLFGISLSFIFWLYPFNFTSTWGSENDDLLYLIVIIKFVLVNISYCFFNITIPRIVKIWKSHNNRNKPIISIQNNKRNGQEHYVSVTLESLFWWASSSIHSKVIAPCSFMIGSRKYQKLATFETGGMTKIIYEHNICIGKQGIFIQ